MCGRYRLSRRKEIIEEYFHTADWQEEWSARYNIAPTQSVPVVRGSGVGRQVSVMRWGLIPSWAKDSTASQINARSETLLEKPTFRESFERRRCLIPADGFYEWKRNAKSRQPFHFGMQDDSLFAFAGIWDRWKPTQGPVVESCAILTTMPNELLNDVHDRMPVILRPEQYEAWLTAPILEIQHHAELFRPCEVAMMKRFLIGSSVNNPQIDSPECVQETPEFSSQTELFS